MRGRAEAAALPALVVALVAVVAITAAGSTSDGTGTARRPSDVILDTLFTLGIVAVVAGGILLLYGLTLRREVATEIASRKPPRTSLLVFLVFFGSFTALTAWRMSKWQAPEQAAEDEEFVVPRVRPTSPPDGGAATYEYEPSIAWIPIAVVVALVVAGVTAYVVAERRRSPDRSARLLAEQLALVLEDTLDDLRAEADPRRAIIAAYARMERVLAANGTPRLASETADEYLPRVLRSLELDPGAVSRLTALFTRAKFSHHDVDTAMMADAIDALVAVRDELRSLAERPPDTAGMTPAAVGAAS